MSKQVLQVFFGYAVKQGSVGVGCELSREWHGVKSSVESLCSVRGSRHVISQYQFLRVVFELEGLGVFAFRHELVFPAELFEPAGVVEFFNVDLWAYVQQFSVEVCGCEPVAHEVFHASVADVFFACEHGEDCGVLCFSVGAASYCEEQFLVRVRAYEAVRCEFVECRGVFLPVCEKFVDFFRVVFCGVVFVGDLLDEKVFGCVGLYLFGVDVPDSVL